jgi:hypothetical protein
MSRYGDIRDVRAIAILAVSLFAGGPQLQAQPRETPAQIRQIVAQSICLAVAYPGTVLEVDSEAVWSVYAQLLGPGVTRDSQDAVRDLAVTSLPHKLTPVGSMNLALARCLLFAQRRDVVRVLGAR